MPYCHTCKKKFHSLGISRHRTAHMERGEECKITMGNGSTYNYSPKIKNIDPVEPRKETANA